MWRYALMGLVSGMAAVWYFRHPTEPASYIAVEYEAPSGASELQDIEVTAGPDRRHLSDLQPGEIAETKVYPLKGGHEIGIGFSGKLQPENAGGWVIENPYDSGVPFRLLVKINEKGEVLSKQFCKLPCSLK